MGNNNELLKFKKFSKGLCSVFKFLYGMFAVVLVVLVIGIIAIQFLPINELMQDTTSGSLSWGYTGWEVKLPISMVNTNQAVIVATTTLVVGIVILSVIMFLTKQVKEILNSVSNESPFSQNVVKHMERLAYGIMVFSVVSSIGEGIIGQAIVSLIKLKEVFTVGAHVQTSIELFDGATLIIGLLILLLAKIFKYGVYLQEEYDATI